MSAKNGYLESTSFDGCPRCGLGLGVGEIGFDDGQVVVVSAARGMHGVVVRLAAELAALLTGGMAGTGNRLGVGAAGVGVAI